MASAEKKTATTKNTQNTQQNNGQAYAQWLVDSGKVKGNMPNEQLVRAVITNNAIRNREQQAKRTAMNNGTYQSQPIQVLSSAPTNPYQNTIKTNTDSINGIDNTYGSWYQNYANQISNNGALQAIENARKNMTDLTNRQYDTNARNYYTQYRLNENKLPERLSNLGVTGGASETAQLALMNNYSGNLYNNETARANALNSGNMQYDQLVAENSKELANQLASTYLNLAKEAQSNKTAQADKEYERAWNEEARQYERYQTMKESTLAFCNMVGRYDNMLGYGWTQAMVDKANKAAQEAKNSVTYSGGGGGSYGGYGSGGYGYDDYIYDYGEDYDSTFDKDAISNAVSNVANIVSAVGNSVGSTNSKSSYTPTKTKFNTQNSTTSKNASSKANEMLYAAANSVKNGNAYKTYTTNQKKSNLKRKQIG